MKHFTKLINLRTLILEYSIVNDKGAFYLSKLNNLTILNLNNNNIGN